LYKVFGIAALLCALTTISLAGVSVSSPTSGSQDSSPVHFVASASGNYPITWMTVYADGNGIYGVGSNNINTNVTMSNGNHYIVVQAWDSHEGPRFQYQRELGRRGRRRWRGWRRPDVLHDSGDVWLADV